ncbi:helix-turn-helix DNA binding domain protein [Rhodobacter phage RcSwan]|nr:helix-turn-helix DNA binding domain protein [Rhodobacter phage RcSwan]
MSHEATNWAIRQRGLKPATKLVLWYLCDRHNPDAGCFPRQDRLASDAEMSVSSLNDHLRILEDRGLIRRVQRSDRKTGQQLSTLYILGFEENGTQDPTPKIGTGKARKPSAAKALNSQADLPLPEDEARFQNSETEGGETRLRNQDETRLRNSETNLVREEPVREEERAHPPAPAQGEPTFVVGEDLLDELIRIAGHDPDGTLPSWWQGDRARDHVAGWAAKYGFSAARILAVARQSRTGHDQPADGPKAFDKAMKRSFESGSAPTKDDPNRQRSPDEICEYFAGLINGTGFLPANCPSTSWVHEILKRGLVTPARMKERGLL